MFLHFQVVDSQKYLSVLSLFDIHFLCYYFKMCILTNLSLFCTVSTNTSSAQMLTSSEFILFRVVVEALGYFIFSLVLFYTCLYTFLSNTPTCFFSTYWTTDVDLLMWVMHTAT
jgi:hypothetical protein